MPLNEDSDIGAKIWLRRLRSRTATAGKGFSSKSEFEFFQPSSRLFPWTHLYCRMYAHSFGIEFLRALLKFKKKKCDARAKLFFCLLNLLVFWSSRCRIAVLPVVYPRTHARSLYCIPSTSFHCVYSLNEYGKRLWTKIFKPKIIGGHPIENFFRKIVNPREHSNRRRR